MRVRLAGAIVLTIGGLARSGGWRTPPIPREQIAELQAIKRSLSPARAQARQPDRGRPASRQDPPEVRPDRGRHRPVRRPDVDLAERLRRARRDVRYVSPRSGDVRAGVPERKLRTIAGWSDVERVDAAARRSAAPTPAAAREQGRARGARRGRAAAGRRARRRHLRGRPRARRRHRARSPPRDRRRHEAVRALGRRRLAAPPRRPRASCPPSTSCPARPAAATRARRCCEILHDLAPGAELGFATAFTSDASLRRQHPRAALRRRLRRDRRRRPVLQRVRRSRTARSRRRSTPSPPTARCTSARPATRATRSTARPATTRATSSAPDSASASSSARRTTSTRARRCRSSTRSRATRASTRCRDAVLGRPARPGDIRLRPVPVRRAGNARGRSRRTCRTATTTRTSCFDTPQLGGSGCGSRSCASRASRATSSSRALRRALQGLRRRPAGLGHAGRDPRPLRGRGRVQRRRRARREPLPFDLLEPGDPPNPRGPFPGVFTVSPGCRSASPPTARGGCSSPPTAPAPQVRQKPDITAADGVVTTVTDFDPFFGTSAAAPHAAAIAGLVLSGNPTADRRPTCARPSRPPRSTSSPRASTTAPATASCAPTACSSTPARRRSRSCARQQPTVSAITGDGDAYLEPGETRARCGSR